MQDAHDTVSRQEHDDEHRELVEAAARLSEPSLAAVWDNSDDDVYNDV